MERFGRYEVIEQLGRGSMGAVYKARDPMMDRDVAVKTIRSHAIEGPEAAEFRERFLREAKAAGRLAHPGIVTVFDVSVQEDSPFLVMEYVAGRTLQSILQSGARMDLSRVCDWGIQLAEALHYAHDNGVIHRDIKPANILVTNDSRTKIADFGVAKLVESSVTAHGQLVGTPAFMAPEQFTGVEVDGRADLFALGVVLYWMATGDKAFSGETTLSVQYKVVHTDPVPPRILHPAIPPDFEAVILKAIEKDPSQRYQSGEEFARDLRARRDGRPRPVKTSAGHQNAERTQLATFRIDASGSAEKSESAFRRLVGKRRIVFAALSVAVFALIAFAYVSMLSQDVPAPPIAAVAPAAFDPAPDRPPETPVASAEVPEPPGRVARPAPIRETAAQSSPEETEPPNNEPEPPIAVPTPPVADATPIPETEAAVEDMPVASPPARKEPDQSYNSARVLITSGDVPESMTVIVSVNNELLFRREAGAALPVEERALPPGQHKLRVEILLAARQVGRTHEVSGRFYSGQRRLLHIGTTKGDAHRFVVTLK